MRVTDELPMLEGPLEHLSILSSEPHTIKHPYRYTGSVPSVEPLLVPGAHLTAKTASGTLTWHNGVRIAVSQHAWSHLPAAAKPRFAAGKEYVYNGEWDACFEALFQGCKVEVICQNEMSHPGLLRVPGGGIVAIVECGLPESSVLGAEALVLHEFLSLVHSNAACNELAVCRYEPPHYGPSVEMHLSVALHVFAQVPLGWRSVYMRTATESVMALKVHDGIMLWTRA